MKKYVLAVLLCLLFYSVSFAQIPYPGNDHSSGVGFGGFPNGYTGNLSFYIKDIVVGGSIGKQGLIWKRRATSRTAQAEQFFGLGHNWTHNWQWEMMYDGTDTQGRTVISIHKPSGVVRRFVEDENGEWASGPNVRDRLVVEGDTFLFQIRAGDVGQVKFLKKNEEKGDCFYPSIYKDAQGNEWEFVYSQGQLTQIIEPAGRWIKIHYSKLKTPSGQDEIPSFNLISRVEASDGQEVIYRYEFPEGSSYPVLVQVLYPDETQAVYIYEKPHTSGRHLLASADDPHGDNRLRASIFRYREETQAPSGLLKDIRSSDDSIISAISWPGERIRKIQKINGAFEYKTYYPGGNIAEIRDSLGYTRKLNYSNDNYGLLESVTDQFGNITYYKYNAYRDKIKTVYPDNTTKEWQYDEAGRLVSSTDELGHTYSFERDGLGRIIRVIFPNGYTREMVYNNWGQVLEIINREGKIATFSVNSRGLCESVTDADGNTSYTVYDAKDRIAEVIDARGNRTVFNRDKAGRAVGIIYADGAKEERAYDRFGVVTLKVDPMGNRQTIAYDDFGRILWAMDPLGNKTAYEYASIGQSGASRKQAINIKYAGGLELIKTFDDNGRLLTETSAVGTSRERQTVYEYNGKGRLIRKTNSLGQITQYFYDSRDRLNREISPLGNIKTYKYNAAGLKTSATNARGHEVQWSYNELGREVKKTDAKGQIYERSYDISGRLWKLIGPNGLVYQYEYDGNGRKTALVYPDGSRETWSYNAVGKKNLYTNRSEDSCVYKYNNRNRMIYSHWDDGSQTTYRKYDKLGRIILIDNDDSKLSFIYDSNSRLLSETQDLSPLDDNAGFDPAPAIIQYTYNSDGSLASMGYPDGTRLEYHYTLDKLLQEVRAGESAEPVVRYKYDGAGSIVQLARENSTLTDFEYDYDAKIIQITDKGPDLNEMGLLGYAYDKTGNPTHIINYAGENIYQNQYEYDAVSQLIGVDRIQDLKGIENRTAPSQLKYEFDKAGNRIQIYDDGEVTSYDVGQLNTYKTAGTHTTQYDGNGNLSSIEGIEFSYDALNRLVSVSGEQLNARFVYDGKNRVVMRNFNGEITFNTFSKWNLIEERDSKGNQKAKYLFGQRTDKMVALINKYGTFYPHYDALGNVMMLTGEDGKLVESYHYAPFGKVNIRNAQGEALTDSAVENRWFFTGREWLSQVGVYDFRNRVYSPTLGRFLQTDPIRFNAGDMNLYRYVFNNPVRFNDPYGLQVRVYSSDALGIAGLNHAFVYSTEAHDGVGRSGQSGNNGRFDGVPKNFDPNAYQYTIVTDLNGYTEQGFINHVRNDPSMNSGLWVPYINDCHTDLEDGFDSAGVFYPGAPNDRIDLDDWFVDSLNSVFDAIYDLFESWFE